MTWTKSQDTAMVPMEKRASAVVGLPPSAVSMTITKTLAAAASRLSGRTAAPA
ncbi:hypothetical protein D3C81_2318760 [compost metagenome]